MFNYYIDVLKKYVVLSGRAGRAEYWYFILINFLIGAVLQIIAPSAKGSMLPSLYSLAVFLPTLGVLFRRLHDVGKSGWWILINLIPLIGWIWMIIILATDGNPGDNKYGPNPKAVKTV